MGFGLGSGSGLGLGLGLGLGVGVGVGVWVGVGCSPGCLLGRCGPVAAECCSGCRVSIVTLNKAALRGHDNGCARHGARGSGRGREDGGGLEPERCEVGTWVRYTHLLAPPAHEKLAGGTESVGARASGALASLAVLGTHAMLSPRGSRAGYRHV